MNVVHGRRGLPAGPLSQCIRTAWCYCWSCHVDRKRQYENKAPHLLLFELICAEDKEEENIEAAFAEVLKQVSISKAFREQIYKIHHYKSPKCFFKNILGYDKERAGKAADPIKRNCRIYDHFQRILDNLSQCAFLDIRRFSTHMLESAISLAWCLRENENMRSQRGDRPVDEAYTEDEFADLLRVIENHPAYKAIDKSKENNFGKSDVTALLTRVQKNLTNR